MKKIIYVPLDERPCNYHFPVMLGSVTDYEIIAPPAELMGDKKVPANVEGLWNWLFEASKDAFGAILSLDTLVYGGIMASRLHSYSKEECRKRLEGLRKLKENNKELKIFAFNLIMRCPRYSSSDEEPDYYENWGKEIFTQGYIKHKVDLGISTDDEVEELKDIETRLPKEYLKDYTNRREINREVNKKAIDYVKENTIDFMIVPQDDSAPYGLTAIDQQNLREYINNSDVNLKVYMYPGADEVGCTLLARLINEDKGLKPLVYTRFSSLQGPFIIPLYEDRLLYESLKYQIIAAGGLMVDSLKEADMVLLVNTPGETMMEAVSQKHRNVGYNVFRNIVEIAEYADYVINTVKKPCIIADVAFANGSDLELIKLLRQKKLLFKLAGYAGWNTSSNTLGTCITQGMLFSIYGDSKENRDFLALRYVEDAGYCAYTRKKVCDEYLPSMGLDYFNADGSRGKVAEIVRNELNGFIDRNLNYDNYKIEILDTYMPWRRMFEVGLNVMVRD